jgi:ABC-type proline/glycine betaine transport system permease subunit
VIARLGRRAFMGPVCAGIATLAGLDIMSQTAVYLVSAGAAVNTATPGGAGVLAILSQVSPATGVLALLTLAALLLDRGMRVVALLTGVAAVLFLGGTVSLLVGAALPGVSGLGEEIGRRLVRQSLGSGIVGGVGLLAVAVLLLRLPRDPLPETPEGPGTPRE